MEDPFHHKLPLRVEKNQVICSNVLLKKEISFVCRLLNDVYSLTHATVLVCKVERNEFQDSSLGLKMTNCFINTRMGP